MSATRWFFGEPPDPNGMITFINEKMVRRTRKPGYTYAKAGFSVIGRTKGGLLAMGANPGKFPPPKEPLAKASY